MKKKGEGPDPLLIMEQLTFDTPSPETWTHFGSDILERKWLLPTLDVIAPIKNEDMGIVFRGYLSFDIDVDVIEKTLRVITRSLIDLMIKVPHGSPMGSSHLKLSISTLQSAVFVNYHSGVDYFGSVLWRLKNQTIFKKGCEARHAWPKKKELCNVYREKKV